MNLLVTSLFCLYRNFRTDRFIRMVQTERHGSSLPETMVHKVFEVQTASLLKIQFTNRIFSEPTSSALQNLRARNIVVEPSTIRLQIIALEVPHTWRTNRLQFSVITFYNSDALLNGMNLSEQLVREWTLVIQPILVSSSVANLKPSVLTLEIYADVSNLQLGIQRWEGSSLRLLLVLKQT